ncbi:hypothetical protein DF186_20230, partial [Enterococcus hirae]
MAPERSPPIAECKALDPWPVVRPATDFPPRMFTIIEERTVMSGRNALATVVGLTVLVTMGGAATADPIASPTLGVGNVVD